MALSHAAMLVAVVFVVSMILLVVAPVVMSVSVVWSIGRRAACFWTRTETYPQALRLSNNPRSARIARQPHDAGRVLGFVPRCAGLIVQ